MNRKLLLFVVLVVILAVASSHNVFASTEIAYDDGAGAILAGSSFSGVRFSLPSGVSRAQIRTVRFAWNTYPDPLVIHITGPDHVTELTAPISVTTTSAAPTFQDVDVFDLGIVVSGDFYVVTERLAQTAGNPYLDAAVNYPRSFGGSSLADLTAAYSGDLLIRVVIESVSPVGGVVVPTNTLAILTPFLALAGLIAAISTVIIIRKRKD